MPELIWFFLESLGVVFVLMSVFFVISLKLKRNDIADIAWGSGFLVLAIYHLLRSGFFLQTKIIITFLIFLWGLRLVLYIIFRNKGKPEDFRYKELRKRWGKKVVFESYLKIFMLQGLLMVLVSLPATLYIRFGGQIIFYSFVGLLVWVVGFYFETVSDLQMFYFKKDKSDKGKILNDGLWKYSRHPNYFGEVTQWWGIWILTIGSTYWYLGLLGPVTITYLILKVSGIPMLEKKYKGNNEFQAYKKHTSAFFPLPPRA